jgi:two-component system, NtrC family, response regulator HydG
MQRNGRQPVRVLVVEDDPPQAGVISRALAAEGREILLAADGPAGLQLAKTGVALVIADYDVPGMNGIQLVQKLRAERISAPVIIVSGIASVGVAVDAMKAGALDFVPKPLDLDFLRARAAQALELSEATRELEELRRKVQRHRKADLIIGVSPAITELRRLIGTVAHTDVAVALHGETGTGKELAARTIHEQSQRSDKPFVVVDCAALPEPLLENELFGHEAGAYTGADRKTLGLLAEGDGGTVFIDEIGEMPLTLQSKLLRFLQTKEFRRVGSTSQTRVDVRVITATNRALEAEVGAGRFRRDLFYRINVFPIRVPPLRERLEDVALLADHFVRVAGKEMSRAIEPLKADALAVLAAHDWPGNVRQLENVVRRLVVGAEGSRIGAAECEAVLGVPQNGAAHGDGALEPFHKARAEVLARFERAYLERLLREAGNNVAAAARLAGIDRKNLWLKLKRYGLGRVAQA